MRFLVVIWDFGSDSFTLNSFQFPREDIFLVSKMIVGLENMLDSVFMANITRTTQGRGIHNMNLNLLFLPLSTFVPHLFSLVSGSYLSNVN